MTVLAKLTNMKSVEHIWEYHLAIVNLDTAESTIGRLVKVSLHYFSYNF